MRVFIPTYRGRDGKVRKSSNFHVSFDDHQGIARRVVGFPVAAGKAKSEAMGNKLVRLAADAALHQASDVETLRWVHTMRPDLREQLATWGLLGDRALLSSLPLWRHLLAFGRNMRTAGTGSKHRRQTIALIVRTLRGIGARHASDIDLESVQTFRQSMRTGTTIGKGRRARRIKISRATANHAGTALVMFARYMHRTGRAGQNALENLRPIKVDGAPARDRRAFRPAELLSLIESTCRQPAHHCQTGRQRALVYAFAAETGLRASEIAALKRQQIDLDAATVTLDDHATKNRKGGTLPLPASLLPLLREQLEGKAPEDRAFTMPKGFNSGRMIQQDLEAAGIAYRDGAGRVVDFHALRHTRGVWLCKYHRLSPRDVQALMRLSSLGMVDRYTRSYLLDDGHQGGTPDLGAAFPPPASPDVPEVVTLAATGTDGRASACATLAPEVNKSGTERDSGPMRFDVSAVGASAVDHAETLRNKGFDNAGGGADNNPSATPPSSSGLGQQILSLHTSEAKPLKNQEFRKLTPERLRPACAKGSSIDPILAAVIEAWPRLTAKARQRVLAAALGKAAATAYAKPSSDAPTGTPD